MINLFFCHILCPWNNFPQIKNESTYRYLIDIQNMPICEEFLYLIINKDVTMYACLKHNSNLNWKLIPYFFTLYCNIFVLFFFTFFVAYFYSSVPTPTAYTVTRFTRNRWTALHSNQTIPFRKAKETYSVLRLKLKIDKWRAESRE